MNNNIANAKNLLRQAGQSFKTGDKTSAQNLIAEALAIDPSNADAWYAASLVTDEWEKKIQALNRALDVDPNNEKARAALSKLTSTQLTEQTSTAFNAIFQNTHSAPVQSGYIVQPSKQISSSVVCPRCYKDDALVSVPGLISQQTTHGYLTSGFVERWRTSSSTHLARMLIPHPRTNLKLTMMALGAAWLIVISSLVAALAIWAKETLWMGFAVPFGLCGLGLAVYCITRLKNIPSRQAYQRAMTRWSYALYCQRCHIVCIEGENRFVDPSHLESLLYS